MAEQDDQGAGLSKKKIAAGAALGVAIPAAVGVAKKLMSDGDGNAPQQDRESGTQRSGGSRQRSGSRGRTATGGARSRATTSGSKSSSSSSKATRSRARTTSSSGSRRRTTASSSSGGSTPAKKERTKEQLYAQAKRLKIEGRSSMNKAQLERAVSRARS